MSAQLQKSVTHTFVGTNAYMAPERILAQSYSVKSDVWSLGISVMELAIGRFPYPADESGRSDDDDDDDDGFSLTLACSPRVLRPVELMQCIVYEPPPQLPPGRYSAEFVHFIQLFGGFML